MKKLVSLFLVISIAVIMALPVYAEIPLHVMVNGDLVKFPDAQPFIDEYSRTQAPARFIGEKLNAKVTWDQETKTARFVRGDSKLEIYIGKKEYKLDGETKLMDTEALLLENRTYVPARYVAEAFGGKVDWYPETRTVKIKIGKVVYTGDTREVNGFIVPKDTKVFVGDTRTSEFIETSFSISFYFEDMEKQKDDLEQIFLQRFSDDTVKAVMDHIRPKMEPEDLIEQKRFYDGKTEQYLMVAESRAKSVIIYLFRKGEKPEF